MTQAAQDPDVRQRYATAHAAHYTTKDLVEAVKHYLGIMATHPASPEAGRSRTQLLNIVNTAMALALLGDPQERARHDVCVELAS